MYAFIRIHYALMYLSNEALSADSCFLHRLAQPEVLVCESDDIFPSCAAAATSSSVSFVYSYMVHGVTSNRFLFLKLT